MQETQFQSLDWADPLEEEPTLVLLPGKFHGQRSLAGYSPWGRKESDMLCIYISVLSLSQRIYTHTHARTCMHTHTHIYNLGDFESTYFSLFPVLVCTLFQSQNNEMLFNGPILNPLCTFSFPVIMTAQYFSVMKKLRLRKMSEYTQGHRARKS